VRDEVDADGAPLACERTAPGPSGIITAALFRSNVVPFGTAMVRRQCLVQLGGFDERYRMGIDWELWLRLSTVYRFSFVDTETYVYRQWPGQMSRNWRGRYDAAFNIMRDFLAAQPGLLSYSVVRDAWADTYVQRARVRSAVSRQHLRALADVALALCHNPIFVPAWRTLALLVAVAGGVRRS